MLDSILLCRTYFGFVFSVGHGTEATIITRAATRLPFSWRPQNGGRPNSSVFCMFLFHQVVCLFPGHAPSIDNRLSRDSCFALRGSECRLQARHCADGEHFLARAKLFCATAVVSWRAHEFCNPLGATAFSFASDLTWGRQFLGLRVRLSTFLFDA